jgi:hypothetical protein
MKMLYLIVFIVMHDGTHDVTAMPVKTCPPKDLTEKYYNEKMAIGTFTQWAAICTTINLSKPKKGI